MSTTSKNETTINAQTDDALFDEFAGDYEAALQQGLSVSGESKDFFAEQRIVWLSQCLKKLDTQPKTILDFGCGTGSSTPFLLDILDAEHVTGVDVSPASLRMARKSYDPTRSAFSTLDEYSPSETVDMAFCNGVFHHIPLAEREEAVNYVFRSLKKGGLFAFWENNPWNPGTRYIMSKIPFDKDAITLTPPEAKSLLQKGGFEVLDTDFLFIFPKSLGFLRALEPPLSSLPLGAQYLVLCRKP